MKIRMVAVLAGWAAGWISYAAWLLGFLLFGMPRHRMVYMVMPVVPRPSLAAQLSVLWLSHRAELVVVLVGFGLSLLAAVVVRWKASRVGGTWLQRPLVQLGLAFIGLVGLLGVWNILSFMLPLQLV